MNIAKWGPKLRSKAIDVAFIHIGHHHSRPDWTIEPHMHPFHELIVLRQGQLHVELRGEIIDAKPGDVLLYPMNWVHNERLVSGEGLEHYFIGFHWPDWPDDQPLHVRDEQGRIGALATWLFQERDSQTPEKARTSAAFLQAIVAEFQRLATQSEQTLVSRVRAQMRRHLADNLTLDLLADYAEVSKYHFVRLYKKLAGRTPMQDLRFLRIQAARDLLLTTDLPLRDVSVQTGLGDEQHLSRLFRRIYDEAPGSYRRRARQRRTPVLAALGTRGGESEAGC